MSENIGLVYSWRNNEIYIVITKEDYQPGIGDLLYVKLKNKYLLLQITGFEGEIPISPGVSLGSPVEIPSIHVAAKYSLARADLFFEIRRSNNRVFVAKPNQPPPLGSPVYLLDVSDEESSNIMKDLSKGISMASRSIPIAWLRSGIASVEELKKEKYFREATLNLDLKNTIPKHVLVAGQTGAGKTTSIMGIITQWARYSDGDISWLIIDRHGEYGEDSLFIREVISKALRLNEKLNRKIHIYTMLNQTLGSDNEGDIDENIHVVKGSLDINSVGIYDLGTALELSEDRISELEEAVSIIASIIEASGLRDEWKKIFIENHEATGQVIALLPLLVDNMFRYEGVGEKEKKGLYRILLNAGIDIRRLRTFRRLILSALGLKRRTTLINTPSTGKNITIYVLDDEESAFKVSPLLKNPYSLIEIMKTIIETVVSTYGVKKGNYPWRTITSISPNNFPSVLRSGNIVLDNIIKKIRDGDSVILDVSKIPVKQGDIIVMSIVRRLFEDRMSIGAERVKELPSIAIVSEEAPLYLSPDKVRSPYNIFARIAREGRKFGIGLVAITQLATLIEKQILANFNTIIALRTKYVSDINYFTNIGIPGETLTSLNDREGYLYTPDLAVKEPIPVYFPAHFEYKEYLENEINKKIKTGRDVEAKALNSIFGDEDE